MRNHLLKILGALTVCCMTLALASPASAQFRRPFGFRVYFGAQRNVDWVIRQAENHTSQLAAMLDARERYGASARVRDLESQLNLAGEEFDRTGNFYDRRSALAGAMSVAEGINREMHYRAVDYDVQRQWSMVRSDLNRLARAYNLRTLF